MPKKKKKIALEDLPKTVLDDNGIERVLGRVYYEKFVYQGYSDVYMLFRVDDGHIVRAVCYRDVREALTDFIRSIEEDMRNRAKRRTDDPPAE